MVQGPERRNSKAKEVMIDALHYGAMAHMAAFEVMIYFMNQEKELAMQRSLMAGAAVGAVFLFVPGLGGM